MIGAREALEPALHAVEIDPPDSYGWLGQRFRLPADGSQDRQDDGDPLHRALVRRLYDDLYCTGCIAPGSDPIGGARWTPAPRGGDDLTAANRGRGTPQEGWVVQGEDGGTIVAERSGLTLWAEPTRLAGDAATTAAGEAVTLLLPNGSRGLPHGFAVAYGDSGVSTETGGAIDRFYWNVRAEGRATLMASVTSTLNGAGLRFRFKVVNDPTEVRCDAGVLYTEADRRPQVADAVREVHAAVAHLLRPRTPLLTKRLAPGLGFAEDPPGEDESFGTSRCEILAAALIEGHGRRTAGQRLQVVADHFARRGLSLDHPHLNPGSDVRRDPAPLDG